jgi:trigger factor
MKAVVEPLEGNKVKLSIEVDEHEFEKDIDAAFRKIAREVRIPGFRPGKAPRRILEPASARRPAEDRGASRRPARLLRPGGAGHEVDAIAPPEIDITAGQESGPVAFDAVVEVRPQLHLAGYGGLRVTVPSPVVTEEDIDAQVDRLRGNFGELTPVDRPAHDGDHLTIDLTGAGTANPCRPDHRRLPLRAGQRDRAARARREASRGQGRRHPRLRCRPARRRPRQLKVLVKDVKEKVLPEVTDEWASEASEFDTVEELRADISKRMGLVKRVQATMALRNATVEALVELVDGDPPESLIDAEVERDCTTWNHRLEPKAPPSASTSKPPVNLRNSWSPVVSEGSARGQGRPGAAGRGRGREPRSDR